MSTDVKACVSLLLFVGLSTALPFIAHLVPVTPLRVLLTVFCLLVLPGYVLLMALFPGRKDLQFWERICLALGLSMAVVPFVGLVLDYTPIGITEESFRFSLSGLLLLIGLVALYRRRKLQTGERARRPSEIRGKSKKAHWLDKAVLAMSVVAGGLVAVGVVAAIFIPRSGERFTEFYVLQPDGRVDGDLLKIKEGQSLDVVLGVVNHEGGDVYFSVEWNGPAGSGRLADFWLATEERWEDSFSVSLDGSGQRQQVVFSLYREDERVPYRTLYLWVEEWADAPRAVSMDSSR